MVLPAPFGPSRTVNDPGSTAKLTSCSAQVPASTVPHPRSYGCFARKIGLYAIENEVVSLAHAIRSIVSNAIEAMPEGGHLYVESRPTEKGEVQKPGPVG